AREEKVETVGTDVSVRAVPVRPVREQALERGDPPVEEHDRRGGPEAPVGRSGQAERAGEVERRRDEGVGEHRGDDEREEERADAARAHERSRRAYAASQFWPS